MGIPQKLRRQWKSAVESHTKRGLHAAASDVRLLLRHGRLEGQCHLRVILQGENALALKEYADRVCELGQRSHHADTVNDISGKSGNALGDDHVDLPGTAVGDHSVELVPVRQRSPAYPFICVDFYQRPVRMMDDKLFIILLLQFVGRGLLDVICRNTGIYGDALRNIIVIVIDLLFSRYELVVVRINLGINPSVDTRLLLLQFLLFALINH